MSIYEAVMDEVRAFFKSGEKSGNKLFSDSDFTSVRMIEPYEDDWGETFQQMTRNMAADALWEGNFRKAERILTRNQNVKTSLENRPQRSRGETWEQFGSKIFNGGLRRGNCREMAAVSGYLMLRRGRSHNQVFVGIITPPGDHMFCAVSLNSIPPMWPRPGTMVRGTQSSNTWIIDPWLHVCCEAEDYWEKAREKVVKWGRDGKRIFWGSGSQGLGWYNPNGEYAVKLGEAPLTWERMNQ